MEVKIDKNVPMPKKTGTLSGVLSAFRKMEIGDSIFIEYEGSNGISTIAKLAGIKVITRTEGNGRRIWRVG